MPLNSLTLKPRFGSDFVDLVPHGKQFTDHFQNAYPSSYKGQGNNVRIIHIYNSEVLIDTIVDNLPNDISVHLKGQDRNESGKVAWYSELNLNGIIRSRGYKEGTFRVCVYYLDRRWEQIKLNISEISSDRTEIRIVPKISANAYNLPQDRQKLFNYANQVNLWWGGDANASQHNAIPNSWRNGGNPAIFPQANFEEFGNFVIGLGGNFANLGTVTNMKVSGWNQLPSTDQQTIMVGGQPTQTQVSYGPTAGVANPGIPDDSSKLIPVTTLTVTDSRGVTTGGATRVIKGLAENGFMGLNTYTEREDSSILIKTLYPIEASIRENTEAQLGFLWTEPREINIKLEKASDRIIGHTILAPADFSNKTHKVTEGDFETWDSLLSSSVDTKQEVLDSLFSSSGVDQANLNIDYRKFDNFIHFSSAEERLKNFKFKLQLLEYYEDKLTTLKSAGSANSYWSLQNVIDYKSKKSKIVNGLDGYEKYLYYTSGSGFHGQTPFDKDVVFLDNKKDYPVASWPKSNLRQPYELYSVTASTATDWYDGMITSASLYDGLNEHNLEKLVPEHIQTDPLNENYFTFVNMVGQHFDTLYNYVDHLTKYNKRTEHIYDGIPKELVYDALKSYGWEPTEGFNLEDLFSYKLGKSVEGGFLGKGLGDMSLANSSGQDVYGEEMKNPFIVASIQSQQAGSQSFYDIPSPASESITKEEVTKEQWKRILNNLPHLGQTKGSERSIRALINTYGMPPSILRIKEYGGIAKSGSAGQLLPRDSFKYSLNFKGQEQLKTPWARISSDYHPNSTRVKPNPLEFRFNTSYPEHQLIVFSSGSSYLNRMSDTWAVELEAHESASTTTSGFYKYGKLNTYIWAQNHGESGDRMWMSASTEYMPLFDNDWWNVQVGLKYAPYQSPIDLGENDNQLKLLVAKAADYGNGRITHSGSSETGRFIFESVWSSPTGNDTTSQIPDYLFWGNSLNEQSIPGVPVVTGSIVPPESSSTSGGFGQGTGYLHWGYSGSIQEIRYWTLEGTDSDELTKDGFLPTAAWENHVRDPLSIESQYYTSSYNELNRRWPLGANGQKVAIGPSTLGIGEAVVGQSSYFEVAGIIGIDSDHPKGQISGVHGDWQTSEYANPYYASASGFRGTSADWSPEEERMFTMMPEIIGASAIGDKIRIDDNIVSGSLNLYESIQSSSLNLASKDSNILGVYFSPNDMIDIDIARQIGGTKFGDFVGDPNDTRSGSYASLRGAQYEYWRKYKTSPQFGHYMNAIKFFDEGLFGQIEKLLPARVNSHLGVMIKPNLLERPKFKAMPSETVELVMYTASTGPNLRPKITGYHSADMGRATGSHSANLVRFTQQSTYGIGSAAIGTTFQVQPYGVFDAHGVSIDKTSEQVIGSVSSNINVRSSFGRNINAETLFETPSYITSKSGYFLIGETTSDDVPYFHSQRTSFKYQKTVFKISSSISPLTGLAISTVQSSSELKTDKVDTFPIAYENLIHKGVTHGITNYEIGGELTLAHDASLAGKGLRDETFNVVEVVITAADDLFPDDLPLTDLGMGGGYTIGGVGNEFIELNFPESLLEDPSVGSGLGTYGCTDPGACNYNPLATNSDGYCLYAPNPLCPGVVLTEPIQGCTQPGALNYYCNFQDCPNGIIPHQVQEDGTCQFAPEAVVGGCTDPLAINYDYNATVETGFCQYETIYEEPDPIVYPDLPIYGCPDPAATNYNAQTQIDNGSCQYDYAALGCADYDNLPPNDQSWLCAACGQGTVPEELIALCACCSAGPISDPYSYIVDPVENFIIPDDINYEYPEDDGGGRDDDKPYTDTFGNENVSSVDDSPKPYTDTFGNQNVSPIDGNPDPDPGGGGRGSGGSSGGGSGR